MSQEGESSMSGAMDKVNATLDNPDDDSATPLLVKASLLTQQVLHILSYHIIVIYCVL